LTEDYVAPRSEANAFNCPWCNAYAQQAWIGVSATHGSLKGLVGSLCARCHRYALWVDEKMVYPTSPTAPLPIEDMPDNVKTDFTEARNVLNASPRAAAALLRLALEKLIMVELGVRGKDLNDAIGTLVKEGLPDKAQKALDSVRVIGNEAVHPGQIDLSDNVETATTLFRLLNWIVDGMITRPRKIDEIYESLPQSKKEAIERRDSQ